MRRRTIRRLQRLLLLFSALLVSGCGLLRPRAPVLLRPGCELRLVDSETGLALPQVSVTVLTLREGRDTVGSWQFNSDEAGMVSMSSLRFGKEVERRPGRYDHIVLVEHEGYASYSQRLSAPKQRIALNRRHLVAATDW